MPLPQSRIGRIVLLGIVLGILLVFVVAASASVALAQESPLPKSPDKGAVGPPIDNPELRNPEDVACRTSVELLTLYPFDMGRDWKNTWLKDLNSAARELDRYCQERTDLTSEDADTRRAWILAVEAYDFHLMQILVEASSKTQTAKSRQKLNRFRDIVAALHFDSGWLVIWEMRKLQRSRIVEVPKEVIRTVEVPAKCAPAELPPPQRDPCADVLRQGASRWYSQLYKWTDSYRGSGADWQLADSSKNDLLDIARGSGDPRSYVIGWLAQWRSIRRHDRTSFLGSGPMPQVAADMRAQLVSCGVYSEDR